MDNTNDNSNDAREARRAARRAGHTTTTSNNNNNGPSSSSSSSIQNEINEIVPHRRNDNKDINHELQNDRHHLAMQHSNERHNRSNNNLSNNNYDRRQSGSIHADSRRSSNANSSDNDPDLRNAVPRTPLTHSGSSSSNLGMTTTNGRPPLPTGPSLVRTLGLTPTYAMETIPSTATSYFRNHVTNPTNPTTGLPLNNNFTVLPIGGNSGSSNSSSTNNNLTIPTIALSADIVTNTINNTSSQPTLISLPPLRTRAAGAGPYALSSTNIPIYEESIVTGAFRKIPMSNNKNKKVSNAASYLQARIAARITFSEMDENENTPLSVELKKVIQSGCRLAQGLLAGVSLVMVLLPTSLTSNSNYNTQFLTSIGILIPSLRFLTWFIAILSWLGAIDQLLTASLLLGNRILPPYQITNTASVSLIKSLRYIHGSVLAYSLVMATVLYSMPAENFIRMGTTLANNKNIMNYTPTAEIITSIGTWKNNSAARCAFALFGWVCVALSTNNPVETYSAIKEAAETELEIAAVENNNNNNNNNGGGNAVGNNKGKPSSIVSPLSSGTEQPSLLSPPVGDTGV